MSLEAEWSCSWRIARMVRIALGRAIREENLLLPGSCGLLPLRLLWLMRAVVLRVLGVVRLGCPKVRKVLWKCC